MPKTNASASKSVDNTGKAVDKVIEIIQFMGDNHLAEIELETPELKMKLKKHSHQIAMPVSQPMMPAMQIQPVLNHETSAKAKKEPEKAAPVEDNSHKINSPMAGTFYRAPSPNSPPFVNEGDVVTVGQTVCIVEAMKMMNEIKADKAGKVVKVLLENGQPVDKGAVLFHIGE